MPSTALGALGLGLGAILAGVALLTAVEAHGKAARRGRRRQVRGTVAMCLKGTGGRSTRSKLGANLRHVVGVMINEGRMRRAAHKLPNRVVRSRHRIVKKGLEQRVIGTSVPSALHGSTRRHHVIILRSKISVTQVSTGINDRTLESRQLGGVVALRDGIKLRAQEDDGSDAIVAVAVVDGRLEPRGQCLNE